MTPLDFCVGAKLDIGEERAILIGFENKRWIVHYVRSGRSEPLSHDELIQLWVDGTLKGARSEKEDAAAPFNREQRSIRDLRPERQESVQMKIAAIEAIDELRGRVSLSYKYSEINPFTGKSETKTALDHALAKFAFENGFKRPIGRSTFYGWRRELEKNDDPLDLEPLEDGRGKTRALHSDAIQIMKEEIANLVDLSRAQIKGGISLAGREKIKGSVDPALKLSQLHGVIATRVENEAPGLAAPSRATVYRELDTFPAFERDIVKFGLTRARNNYRMTRGKEPPEHCLDDTEYDESLSRIFVFCEASQIALGRAIFCWFLCTTTTMPLGFYIGFEPMSDVSTMAAWKHAVLPKNYVKRLYPDVHNHWGAHGMPRSIRFDNGLSQHGNTVKATAFDLGRAKIVWAKPYVPWFKSDVEGFHHQLNECLLDQLPGGIPIAQFRHDDYDPTISGCIGLRHLVWIVHKWLIDIQIQQPRGILQLSAAQKWATAVEAQPPSLPAASTDIELLFSIRRKARLDHRGVHFHLDYIADWMEQYRKDFGKSTEVEICIFSPNMGHIYVVHPKYGPMKAQCKQFHIANGRSLEYIRKLAAHALERFKSIELPAIQAAEKELQSLAMFALDHAKSIALNKDVARTFGIGTDTLFAGHRLTGDMGEPTGHFAGQSINPLQRSQDKAEKPKRGRKPASRSTPVAPHIPKRLPISRT